MKVKLSKEYLHTIHIVHISGTDQSLVRGLRNFVSEVNRVAEEKMLATNKLEGSHCAAMREVLAAVERELS